MFFRMIPLMILLALFWWWVIRYIRKNNRKDK